jgi:S-sulfo-L-cysteine synthase (3-phospho-L-serine-dependent)
LHITSKVAEWLELNGPSYEAAKRARFKHLARKAYKDYHVPSVLFEVVHNEEDAVKAAESIGYLVILKPTNCASSQGVSFVSTKYELIESMKQLQDFKHTYLEFNVSDEYLVKEYLEGPEFSVELFLQNGRGMLNSY